MNEQTRRQFLLRTGCAGLGAMALSAGFEKLGLMNLYAEDSAREAVAAAGYRALVCIFLFGGNDSSNMVIPIDTNPSPNLGFSYPAYSGIRQGSGLAIPLASVLPLNPQPLGSLSLHPSNSPSIQNLFNLGKLAVVTNVGPLVQPLTRTTTATDRCRGPTSSSPFRSAGDLAERARRHSLAERLGRVGREIRSFR